MEYLQNLGTFISQLIAHFSAFPKSLQMAILAIFLLGILLINALIILPIIFNFFVIPKLEQQQQQKLSFTLPTYDLILLSKWTRYLELVWYISFKSIAAKMGFDPAQINLGKRLALQVVNYDVRQSQGNLICLSVFSTLNFLALFPVALFIWSQAP